MMLERHLVNRGHVHHFVVRHDTTGWDVREEEDSKVIRQAHLDDWHRVERAVQLFDDAAVALERDGWIERRPERCPVLRSSEGTDRR
jgi:hypothetical protein